MLMALGFLDVGNGFEVLKRARENRAILFLVPVALFVSYFWLNLTARQSKLTEIVNGLLIGIPFAFLLAKLMAG